MSNTEITEKRELVNVRRVFRNKNPKLSKWIPGFVYSYLEQIIHQDELNHILNKYAEFRDLDFIDRLIEYFNVSVEIKGSENIPKKGRFVFASNHCLGGFDGIVLMYIIGKHFKKIKFLVNDILMNLVNLNGLFIPINKHGKQGIHAARQIEKTYASDMQILTFPAGLVSRKIKTVIMDLAWQKSFIIKSVKHKRDIIPVHFSGRNTRFFYGLSRLRNFLGIKTNIEMLYLSDETFKHKNKKFNVRFGEPIPWQTFDSSKKPIEWAKWVKEKVYALNEVFDVPL